MWRFNGKPRKNAASVRHYALLTELLTTFPSLRCPYHRYSIKQHLTLRTSEVLLNVATYDTTNEQPPDDVKAVVWFVWFTPVTAPSPEMPLDFP